MTIELCVDELDKRYPNDIFILDKLSEKEKIEYVAKLKLIDEIRKIGGLNVTK